MFSINDKLYWKTCYITNHRQSNIKSIVYVSEVKLLFTPVVVISLKQKEIYVYIQ